MRGGNTKDSIATVDPPIKFKIKPKSGTAKAISNSKAMSPDLRKTLDQPKSKKKNQSMF